MRLNLNERLRKFKPFSTNDRFIEAVDQAEKKFPGETRTIDNIVFDVQEEGKWTGIILGVLFTFGTYLSLSGIEGSSFWRVLAADTVFALTSLCSAEYSYAKGLKQLARLGKPREQKIYREI